MYIVHIYYVPTYLFFAVAAGAQLFSVAPFVGKLVTLAQPTPSPPHTHTFVSICVLYNICDAPRSLHIVYSGPRTSADGYGGGRSREWIDTTIYILNSHIITCMYDYIETGPCDTVVMYSATHCLLYEGIL